MSSSSVIEGFCSALKSLDTPLEMKPNTAETGVRTRIKKRSRPLEVSAQVSLRSPAKLLGITSPNRNTTNVVTAVQPSVKPMELMSTPCFPANIRVASSVAIEASAVFTTLLPTRMVVRALSK